MASKGSRTIVKVVKGPDQGNEFVLDPAEIYEIGRGSHSKVRLNDQTVSHDHARLENTGGLWFVVDLGSRHGTLVNKQHVSGRKALFDRDTIRIGKSLLEFREFEPLDKNVVDEAQVGFKKKT